MMSLRYKAWKRVLEKHGSTLNPAQKRITEDAILDFELAGIALEGEQKKRFNAIKEQLAKLSKDFLNNELDAMKAFDLKLTKKEEVKGIPKSSLAQAAQTAREKGDKDATAENGPWRLSLDYACYDAVMKHADDRELRAKVHKAY